MEIVSSLYPECYSDDEDENRLLHVDDEARASKLALTENVIQLYPPSRTPSGWRGTADFCAKTFDLAARFADRMTDALEENPRQPPIAQEGRSQPIQGTGYAKIQVSFLLEPERFRD